MTVGERIDQQLRDLTKPLMNQLAEIELEIEVREGELKELRGARTRLVAIARQIDPELAPKKVAPTKAPVPTSEALVEKVLRWLDDNVNGDEFYTSGLMAREDFKGITSGSQLSKVMRVLHDRGQITLVRSGSGGSKHYRLVR